MIHLSSLQYLILAVLGMTTCLCQPLLWTCPPSTDNEVNYFPNIAFDDTSIANSVRDSPYLSGLYVYRFEPVINATCNSIPVIEVCYEISETASTVNMSILLGSINVDDIEADGTTFTGRVFAQAVISTAVNCNLKKALNDSVCCQSVRIDVTLSTELIQQINAFGVEFPNQTLLEYSDPLNMAKTFVASGLDFLGFSSNGGVLLLRANGQFMNLNLRYLRFVIKNSKSANTTLVVVLPIVGGLILIILLSTIAVVIFAIKWRKRKSIALLGKDPQKAIDNANYGDRVHALSGRSSNVEKSSNAYDYAVASSELDSGARIVRAASYEVPIEKDAYNYETSDEDIYVEPAADESSLYGQFSQLKVLICRRDTIISLKTMLGSGQFGTVHKGEWLPSEGGKKIEVAVKTLKEGAGEEDKIKFLQEAAIMGQFSHPNVVKLYGIVTKGEPVMLILELLPEGDLLKVLQSIDLLSIDPDLPHTLLSYCRQVASGMGYLALKSFIHRDLAARNILMSEDGVCKIADFGMSRDLADENYYRSHGGKIPVKWTAPEALHFMKYSTASDVWSYGCVMYEIWSLGHKPFEGCSNVDCIKIIDKGTRLAPPPGCPRILYKLMIDCWHPDSSRRPDFVSVVQQLSLPDTKLLKWSEEDKATDAEAATLGAGLDKAVDLYKDLQKQYNL